MWPRWLTETLDRSALEARPHAAAAGPQRVRDPDHHGERSPYAIHGDDVIEIAVAPESEERPAEF